MSTERGEPDSSSDPSLYYQAAKFDRERQAKRAYFRCQETVFQAQECDLSVYRFLLDRISHVAVIGQTPPEEIDRRLRKLLAAGEPTSLPADIIQLLFARRIQAAQQGSWVEGHYRPGRPMTREDFGGW